MIQRDMSNLYGRKLLSVAGGIAVFLLVSMATATSAHSQVRNFFDEGDEIFVPEEEDREGSGENSSGLVIERGGSGSGVGVGTTRSIRLEYQRRGHSILVPARVDSHDVYFIFDTGATFTTLTADFARQVGASPGADYPTVMMQTAGGVRETQFGLLRSLRLGTARIENISFTVCDPCGGQMHQGVPIVGLLGLNVLRRYRVSVDDARGVVELEPNTNFDDRSADMNPWMQGEIQDVTVGSDGTPQVNISLANRAPKRARNMVLEFICTTITGERRAGRTGTVNLGARGSADVAVRLNPAGCVQMETHVVEGRW